MDDVESAGLWLHTKRVLLAAMVVLIIGGIVAVRHHNSVLGDDRTQAKNDMVALTARGAAELDKALTEVERAVDAVFDALHERASVDDRDGLEALLLNEVAKWPSINGVEYGEAPDQQVPGCNTAPERVVLDDPYEPYAVRISGVLELVRLDQEDTAGTPYICRDWYLAAIAQADGGADPPPGVWIKPRKGTFSNTTLGFYSRAVLHADGTVAGVLLGTTAVDNLTSRLGWERVSPHGYSFIVDEDGTYVSHPLGQLVEEGCSITPTGEQETGDCERGALPPLVEQETVDYRDPVTGSDAWLASASVATSGWEFLNVNLVGSALPATTWRSRLLVIAAAALLGAAVCAISAAALRLGRSPATHWVISITLAVAALSLVGVVWRLQDVGPGDQRFAPTEFAGIAASVDEEVALRVGVFVQSLEFTGANDVAASGLIWQVGPDTAAAIPPVFAEATSPVQLEQAWGEAGETSFGWQFSVTLRQEFNYGEYPLDKEQIWIRLRPGDFTAPIVLLPDLDAYLIQAPVALPGLADALVLEGWDIERSFFATEATSINTEIGTVRAEPDQLDPGIPQLFFVVDLDRSFVGPFVSQVIPLAAVNIMLFSALLLVRPKARDDDSIGGETLGVLGYVAALFFVVIVTHNDLRSRLGATELVFLERFYFTTYGLLILVTANSLLLSLGRGGRFINNLWPKVAYWPLFSLLTLVSTLNTFG